MRIFKIQLRTHIESEPTPRGTEEDLAVLPFGEVREEVATGSLGSNDTLHDGIGVNDESSGSEEIVDVGSCLLDIALDIHGETGSFGDRQTEVEGEAGRDTPKTDEETPHRVDMSEIRRGGVVHNGILEGSDNDHGDNRGRWTDVRNWNESDDKMD